MPPRRRISHARLAGLALLASLSLAGLPLIRDDPPKPADAIVVIGGDHKPERLQLAAQLFQAGYAPVVVLSAGNEVLEGTERLAEAEVMRRQALVLGLPESALLLEPVSQSTFQNAYCIQALAAARGWRSILLVTSQFHSRRAGRIFTDVFGDSLAISVQPGPAGSCALCWWFQPDQLGVVAYEYYNWGRYTVGHRLPVEARPSDDCLE